MRKMKYMAVFLISITIIVSVFTLNGCVDKNSPEYRFDIKRFLGEYEVKGPNLEVELRITNFHYEVFPGTQTNEFWGFPIGKITEQGYYYRTLDTGEIVFRELEFDVELVKAVNQIIDTMFFQI